MRKDIQSHLFTIFKKTYHLLASTPLTRVPHIWRISNFFFRVFWPKKDVIEVQGSKMLIRVDDPDLRMRKTFQAYAINLIHEEGTTGLFKKVVKPGHVVVDLGSNIGYFTLLAAKLVGKDGKVFSFEPEPRNFEYLKNNLVLNNYHHVYVYQKAVSNQNGKTKLYICSYDSGHHTINQPEGIELYRQGRAGETKEIEIDVVSLDSFLEDKTEKVDAIKIDVEGAEALAIRGMQNLLKKNQKIKIFLEFFPLLIKGMGSSPQDLVESLMNDLKFSVFAIGCDYSISDSKTELLKITSYEQLMGLLKEETDHLNLYLTRDADLR